MECNRASVPHGGRLEVPGRRPSVLDARVGRPRGAAGGRRELLPSRSAGDLREGTPAVTDRFRSSTSAVPVTRMLVVPSRSLPALPAFPGGHGCTSLKTVFNTSDISAHHCISAHQYRISLAVWLLARWALGPMFGKPQDAKTLPLRPGPQVPRTSTAAPSPWSPSSGRAPSARPWRSLVPAAETGLTR